MVGQTVIIGIGNERRRDDAIGLAVARLLAAGELPEGVRVEEAWSAMDLLTVIDDAPRAIVLAAVQLGSPPGSIHVLSPADAEARADYISLLGEMPLVDALGLGGLIGVRPQALIVGVEPTEIVPGMTLSRDVKRSVRAAAEVALELAADDGAWRAGGT